MEEEFIKEDKESIEDVGEGEPEEGEIMDDEEEKNQIIIKKEEKQQKEIKQKISETEKIKENKESSPNHSSSLQSSEQQIKSEFQRGSSSWRKSFGFSGGHHGGSGRGSIGSSRFSRGGNDSNARYRDFDGRVAMRNNDQQEEEMLDSWNACIRGSIHNPHHYNSRRGGRMNSPSGGGDISPIRTSPMIEEDEEKDFSKSSEQSPLKKQTEIPVTQQQQIDDDKDFRGIDSNTIESPSPQNKQSPHHQHYSDDNDFRRSSIHQSHFNRQTSPSLGFSEERQFEGNKRRHCSQSPPVNIQARSQFPHESEDFDTPYGNAAKRYRPFYGSGGPPSGDGFAQKDENFDNFPPYDENGPWSSRPHRGGEEGDFPHQFYSGGDRGGRGGRTQGWGYRGGRPFFPRLICKFFREGFCRDGDQCTFSHLTGDSHRRPELCRYYQQGYCKKGLFCQLMHGEWPCKAFHKGECSKEQCSFSHEPLDDVSRPIMDKILEEEKLGLTRPPQQQHPRFDVPQQQTPHMGRGVRPFFRPRFQGPYHEQIGGQNFPQSQGPQAPQRQFHRNPHQQIGLGAPQPPQQHQQQPFFKKQQHPMSESSAPRHPLSPENLHQGSSEINMLNEETGGICLQQQQPSIPPPGLVMPPPLGGGSPLPLPASSSSSATFGFFNPVSTQTTPSNQPPQQSQPPPSFQQLQQQVHQVAGPHFPHQPSLLGPSSAAAQAQAMLTAILQQSQQTGSTQSAKGAFRDNSLQRSPPPPPPPKKKEVSQSNIEDQQQLITKTEIEEIELKPATNTGGFNINQMLEQITKQNSPPPPQPPIAITNIKREETNTLDLLANVELSDSTTNIVEESPASPVFASEQQQENENKPAALIPVVREWKLHLVDLSPLTECSDMHFDIKLVQQISSSNSDPRLRKIAEKQFDLVSKTLEQQQANQQKNNFNEGIFAPTEQIKKEIEKREAISDVNYETGLQDPRTKDPRRKREISGISSTSSLDEAELVKKQMAALEAAAKQQQNCEQSSQLFSTQLGIRQQLGLPPPTINFQLPPPPAFLPGNPMGNQFFTVPPPFSLQQQQQLPQNFSTPPPSTYQQINQIVTSSHQNLEAQTFNTEQLPCSSSIDPSKSSNSSFEKIHSETSSFPSYQYSRGYRGRRGRYSSNYHHHHHQQHYREHNQQNIRRSESPPKQQQQEENVSTSSTISLREKRKNNEYESPLARMANNRY